MATFKPEPGVLITELHERFFKAIKKYIDAEMAVDHWIDVEAREFCYCIGQAISAQGTLRDCTRESTHPNAASLHFTQLRGDAVAKKFTDILGITIPRPAPRKRRHK